MACPTCHAEFPENTTVCPHEGTPLVPAVKDSLIGTTFADRYEILDVIGRGGMCVVYKARQQFMQNLVAIKVLYPQYGTDPSSLARFKQEAQAAAEIKHPNVIQVLDFGITPSEKAFLIMEYLEGDSLADWLQKHGDMPVDRAMNIFVQACDGLVQAHKKGVIHRDLKPGNIVLIDQESGHDLVKIVDFGIAKRMINDKSMEQNLTQPGEVFGSPLYMSPEQCQGAHLDARSDIYSLGCVMYETLGGMPPFMGSNSLETMNMHVGQQPLSIRGMVPGKDIPPLIDAVVLKALKKDPDKRQQTMLDLKKELVEAAQKSRLNFQKVSGHAPDIYGNDTDETSPVEARKRSQADDDTKAMQELVLEAAHLAEEKDKKNKQLTFALITLGWAFSAGVLCWAYNQFAPGPSSDPANTWNRGQFLGAIGDGEKAMARDDYKSGVEAYQRAVDISKNFGDGNEKKVKGMLGLLTCLEHSNASEEQLNEVRRNLLQASLKHMKYLCAEDPKDLSQMTDLDKGLLEHIEPSKLDSATADGYSKQLVAEARSAFQRGLYQKAISWLEEALEMEEQAHGHGGVAVTAKEFVDAPEGKQHVEEIEKLLRRAEVAEKSQASR